MTTPEKASVDILMLEKAAEVLRVISLASSEARGRDDS
jgi:hypothetical protein